MGGRGCTTGTDRIVVEHATGRQGQKFKGPPQTALTSESLVPFQEKLTDKQDWIS